MSLPAAEHQAIARETKDRRNSAGRDRRRRQASTRGNAYFFEVELPGGEPVRLVIVGSDRERAQVLRLDRQTGKWMCRCFAATYGKQHTCAHEAAANGQEAPAC